MSPVKRAFHAPPARAWIERLWSSLAERAHPSTEAPSQARARLLAEALLSESGEASGMAIAQELHHVLAQLAIEERLAFYRFVAAGFAPDQDRLRAAAQAYLADSTPETAASLADAAEPPRQELIRRLNVSPGATAFLIAARKEILDLRRSEPDLRPLDMDLKHLLSSWFNRGFLDLRRIDWQSPAAVLEKLIAYEAVHQIDGWEDLRRRLAPDRRCFGFFHPALPGEPLIFVEVALVQGLSTSVQPLIEGAFDAREARAREHSADTAVFYSISNCQDGLRGISFGNFLIKQVVEELSGELPGLRHFATLSPVPGFRRWLERRLAGPEDDPSSAAERSALELVLATPDWSVDDASADVVRPALLRLCALYLISAGDSRRGADPVARFHLHNGARLERINWGGNVAPRGVKESFGIMVNYLYDPEAIEANHEAFARNGAAAMSAEVESLLEPARKKAKRKA